MNRNDYLPLLIPGFGERGFTVISDLDRLPILLPKLYLNLTGNAGEGVRGDKMNRNDYLPLLIPGFGERGFTVISDLDRLPILLPKLYLNLTGNPA